MKLALVASSLSGGGTARVVTALADGWVRSGKKVTLITLSEPEDDFYRVRGEVERVGLGMLAPSTGILHATVQTYRRIRALRACLRETDADAVVGFGDTVNVQTILASRGLDTPAVVSERVDPRFRRLPRRWRLLRRVTYPRAEAVVVQAEAIRPWTEGWLDRERVWVVPNPVEPPGSRARPPRPGGERGQLEFGEGERCVVGMGRLVPQKGFDLLVRAFARCAPRHPGWSLVVLGEGPERRELEALARRLEIGTRVSLPGRVAHPWERLPRADLFVLSSRFEGFPNVLLEAMARGVPAVSFDCPSGPGEIIRHGEDGLLVPAGDVEALADAMTTLMEDEGLRRALGERAPRVLRRYGLERVLGMWDDVLADVVRRPAS